jgi:hypothetical protein
VLIDKVSPSSPRDQHLHQCATHSSRH